MYPQSSTCHFCNNVPLTHQCSFRKFWQHKRSPMHVWIVIPQLLLQFVRQGSTGFPQRHRTCSFLPSLPSLPFLPFLSCLVFHTGGYSTNDETDLARRIRRNSTVKITGFGKTESTMIKYGFDHIQMQPDTFALVAHDSPRGQYFGTVGVKFIFKQQLRYIYLVR